MKNKKRLQETTNRREYHILRTVDDDPYSDGCSICPMYDHCSKHKRHKKCKPNRVRERNWKSQRKFQRRNIK
jgi:hypothetical protein